MSIAKRSRPACPTCGHTLVNGECVRLELHWTVCPTHKCQVPYGKTCGQCQ
jgi:hypothetical protein